MYKKLITNLNKILSFSCKDFTLYDRYSYQAIRDRAYFSIVPFLEELNKRYQSEIKILERLGKTLCNSAIGEVERGIIYIIEAANLCRKRGEHEKYLELIVFYLQALLTIEKILLLESKLEKHAETLNEYYGYN